MKLTQLVSKDEKGNVTTMWEFTEEQIFLLLNIAVNYLLGHGLADVEQKEREKAVEH